MTEPRIINGKQVRALSLLSGGLDSILAICVLKEQGIEVEGLTFESPFFGAEPGRIAAQQLGIRLHVVDYTDDILRLLNHPPHGFGSCMNPCIDCHAGMFRRAGGFLAEWGLDFLGTGEVLNERPMSQNKQSLLVVARDSGYPDLVLRPLSAQLLDPTKPELDGLVDRTRLLSLQGRSRKPQMALARQYGIDKYPTPAGGCKLTDPVFSVRLADLKEHEGLGSLLDVNLLKAGRHFRLGDRLKLIVGRNFNDNNAIEHGVGEEGVLLKALGVPGPTAVLRGPADADQIARAAAMVAGFSDAQPGQAVIMQIRSAGQVSTVDTVPLPRAETDRLRV